MDGIKVLSLFDGISCGQIALERAGIKVNSYFASEIKKHAIITTQARYPSTIQLGDITKISYRDGVLYTNNGNFNVGTIDLLLGGSPCQNFSIARISNGFIRDGLDGDKSKLFYEYLRLKKEITPKHFLLENVRMKKESKEQLDDYLGVDGMLIDSDTISYQKRPRIYWTDIPNLTIPTNKNINFQNHKDNNHDYCKQFKVNKTPSRERMWNKGQSTSSMRSSCANITKSDKIYCVTCDQDRAPNSGLIEFEDFCRYLTTRELEIAQTLPVGYTNGLSIRQAQDVIGDGWTVDVIVHILKNLPEEWKN
jgi:DNA (cytosine-5)-methyltransferase 3A